MAYNTPPTKSVGDTLTAAEWNTYVRDNLAAGAPDLFTAKGDLLAATAANAGAALAVGADYSIPEALTSESVGIRWATYPPFAVLLRATAVSIPNDSSTQVTGFTASQENPAGLISGDTIVVPSTGLYFVGVTGYYTTSATAGTIRKLGIDDNTTNYWQGCTQDTGGKAIDLSASMVRYLSAGAVIKMIALQASGGPLDLYAARFVLAKLR